MSYKPTPVTAKIQKTTKGGICNPLLNVGTMAQMKAPSIANKKFSTDPKEKAKQKQWIKDNPEKYKEPIEKKRKSEADSEDKKNSGNLMMHLRKVEPNALNGQGPSAPTPTVPFALGWWDQDSKDLTKTENNSEDGKKVVKKKAYLKKSGKLQKLKKVTTNNNTSQLTQKDSYIDQDKTKATKKTKQAVNAIEPK